MSACFRIGLPSFALAAALCTATVAQAACPPLPHTIANGQVADATKVMDDLEALRNCAGAGGATNSVQINTGSGTQGGVGPLTDGQLVIGSTGNAPQAANITAGSGIAVNNGPGSITISAIGVGGALTLIQREVVGDPVPQIIFSNIPNVFEDLVIIINGRISSTSPTVRMSFNYDDGNNYDWQRENRFGQGSGFGEPYIEIGDITGSNSTANFSSQIQTSILSYSREDFYKSALSISNTIITEVNSNVFHQIGNAWWKNTAAINSVSLKSASGNFQTGTVISLFARQ